MDNDESKVNVDLMSLIGDDALRIFRINLVVFAIFLPAILIIYRDVGADTLLNLYNIYTMTGILLWLGSMFGAMAVYRMTRREMLRDEYRDRGVFSDEINHLNTISAVAFSSFFSIYFLIVGLVDASLPLQTTFFGLIGILVIGVTFSMVFFNLFAGGEYLRQKVPSRVWEVLYGNW